MGTNEENFRVQLTKMAQMVDIIEDTFKESKNIKVNIELMETDFNDMCRELNNDIKNDKSIISIGNVEFIFLKK
jgi:hypothetical protein